MLYRYYLADSIARCESYALHNDDNDNDDDDDDDDVDACVLLLFHFISFDWIECGAWVCMFVSIAVANAVAVAHMDWAAMFAHIANEYRKWEERSISTEVHCIHFRFVLRLFLSYLLLLSDSKRSIVGEVLPKSV